MILFFSILTVIYLIFVAILLYGWFSTPAPKVKDKKAVTKISVLIAARNEAENIEAILTDLSRQTYPKLLFEVIVINDHSEDKTSRIVRDFIGHGKLNLKLTDASTFEKLKGKKAAIQTGLLLAEGELIITTDADCRVNPEWITTIESFYRENNLKMVCGPVAFKEGENLFQNMQQIEFSSLIGSGAATLKLGIPSMCNGANLAYVKSAFDEVNGYAGNETLASGDDEFLMHKIYAKFPGSVAFLKDREALVYTKAQANLKDFFHQRRRWASKWDHYSGFSTKIIAAFIFIYNFSLLLVPLYALINPSSFYILLGLVTLKILGEFVFLRKMSKFYGIPFKYMSFLILEFIYPFYVSFFAIFSKCGKYSWKGRELK